MLPFWFAFRWVFLGFGVIAVASGISLLLDPTENRHLARGGIILVGGIAFLVKTLVDWKKQPPDS